MNQERVKKKLLIIKSSATGLMPVESFLKNREWELKSTSNLKEALIFLVQQSPEFVMISIDHPNKKVRNLPRVLAQAFPACVIAFTEDNTAASHNLLNNCSTKYMLYPPITGPAVERTVHRYYRDLQNDGFATTQQAFEAKQAAAKQAMIAIRGDSIGAEPTTAQNFLANFLSDDSDNIIQTGMTALSGSAAEGAGASALNSAYQEGGLGTGGLPQWAPIDSNAKIKNYTAEDIEADPRSNKSNSLIFKGTKEALEQSCFVSAEKARLAEAPLETSQNTACILIDSTRFSGYLITAMSDKSCKIDEAFLNKIRTRLFSFLKSNGEKIEEHEPLNLNLRQVPFEDWALKHADFLLRSKHDGQDVAMAFFPMSQIKAEFQESADSDMVTIKMSELQGDVAVEFNVYVHLPKNNKYVLYTPRGSTFYGVQKDRLVKQGISELHIMKSDLNDLDRYRAQNYLNDKIKSYEQESTQ